MNLIEFSLPRKNTLQFRLQKHKICRNDSKHSKLTLKMYSLQFYTDA